MRPLGELRTARRLATQYDISVAGLSRLGPLPKLQALFGNCISQVPPVLQLELVAPELRRFPQTRHRLEKQRVLGTYLLDLYLNDYLGTQNVTAPARLYERFVTQNNLEDLLVGSGRMTFTPSQMTRFAADIVTSGVGAVHMHSDNRGGSEPDQNSNRSESIQDRLVAGPDGLAQLYLNHVGRL